MDIFNADCFDFFNEYDIPKIDLVVVDLPYGQTNLKWDTTIDLKKMWIELKKVCARDCIYVFFCTTKFGYTLIKSNESYFRYDLIWEKSRKLGFLSANKMPLRKHEMVYIFSSRNTDDLDKSQNLGIREYARKVKEYINKSMKEISIIIGNLGIKHFYSFNSTQFELPTKDTYNKLISEYKLRDMEGFREHASLKADWKKYYLNKTYNPQKTEGKAYSKKAGGFCNYVGYGKNKNKNIGIDNKGDRHPSSILKFDNPKKSIHPTQKPVALCEWLIKTYSNEGDNVLDFTMGSGSTGIACLNTKRLFIGVERDEEIYKLAQRRLLNHEITSKKYNTTRKVFK
jgi:DNA modification methylase